ncbi:YbhN family protein [Streptomyces axinellae]|uniref:Integral membrane protein n=1 Tax=Streptomyces axinellae TaxID=552788 RepID=A0ABN3R066_9ACTN
MVNQPERVPEDTAQHRAAAVRPWWWVVSAVLLVLAVAVAVTRRDELGKALRLIGGADPERLVAAAVLEGVSLLWLAAVQRWLLRAGDSRIGLGTVTAIVLGANALAGALPGGAAFAAAWVFRQLRKRQVSQALAGAVLVTAGALSSLALFLLLVAGVLAGGSGGPGAALRPGVLVVAACGAVLVALAYGLSRLRRVRRRAWRLWRRIGLRSSRLLDIEQSLSRAVRHARTVHPGLRPWLGPFAFALLNWLCDLACLLACAWSLGVGVPWQGIVTAYALTQLAGSLRLTPGGLGVVETSLSALLTWYGLRAEQAIAVTLLYRTMSYWALQPVGWAALLGLLLPHRRGRHRTAPPPE